MSLAVPAVAVDPFYLRLLRDGSDAFNRQEYTQAVTLLRRAAFGMLNEPLLLADGLSRLGLAQAAAGDHEGFRETFRRLMEVEELFEAYSKAEIASDVRSELERQVMRLVPKATLADSPTFAPLIPKPEDRVAEMPLRQRRRELERLIRAEPGQILWSVMLAELELQEGRHRQAISQAEGVLRVDADNSRALRVRGLAQASRRRWSDAVEDLARSGLAEKDPRVAASLLEGLLAERRVAEAVDVFRSLPPVVAEQALVAEQGLRAEAALENASARSGETQPEPRQEEPPAMPVHAVPGNGDQQVQVGADLPAGLRQQIHQIRRLADQGNLAEALARARMVANDNPGVAEAQHLAGEMAYRHGYWSEAVAFFRHGGDPGALQPVRRFYFAVALFESGDQAGARRMLEAALPNLPRNEFVSQMVAAILGPNR